MPGKEQTPETATTNRKRSTVKRTVKTAAPKATGNRKIADLTEDEFKQFIFAIDDAANENKVNVPGIGGVKVGNGNWFTKASRIATTTFYTVGAACGIGVAGKMGYEAWQARQTARKARRIADSVPFA